MKNSITRATSRIQYQPSTPAGSAPVGIGRADVVERLVKDHGSPIEITFSVLPSHAPALRSALDEIRQEVGTKLEGPKPYATEYALTAAAIALAALAAAVNQKIPMGDPDYV